MTNYKPIAESNNFIILDKYNKEWKVAESYQSEDSLEREFIQDLQNQGYEYLLGLNNPQAMLANVRVQLQSLNSVEFLEGDMLTNSISEGLPSEIALRQQQYEYYCDLLLSFPMPASEGAA